MPEDSVLLGLPEGNRDHAGLKSNQLTGMSSVSTTNFLFESYTKIFYSTVCLKALQHFFLAA
jgi:hypothetical protein